MVPVSSRGFFPAELPILFYHEDNMWINGDDNYNGNPIISRIESVGFERIMSNVADSFTKMGLEKTNGTFNGTVHINEVFVSVRWLWLIVPAFSIVTGSIFFVGTMAVNRRAKMPLLKSSALAPFYHGLEKFEENEFMTASVMETAAERAEVQLECSEINGRLMLRPRY